MSCTTFEFNATWNQHNGYHQIWQVVKERLCKLSIKALTWNIKRIPQVGYKTEQKETMTCRYDIEKLEVFMETT